MTKPGNPHLPTPDKYLRMQESSERKKRAMKIAKGIASHFDAAKRLFAVATVATGLGAVGINVLPRAADATNDKSEKPITAVLLEPGTDGTFVKTEKGILGPRGNVISVTKSRANPAPK